jgi:predicted GH43/DUF377 family glycosyl hydrolase
MAKVKKTKKSATTRSRIKGCPLAVFGFSDRVAMIMQTMSKTAPTLFISWSFDGFNFTPDTKKISLKTSSGKNEKLRNCHNFCISAGDKDFILTYLRTGKIKNDDVIVFSRSKNFYSWKAVSEIPAMSSSRASVVYDESIDRFELYKDGLFIKNQSAKILSKWNTESALLFTSRGGFFDDDKISIIDSLKTDKGIVLLYDASITKDSETMLQVGGVLFDNTDPRHIIWRSPVPLWQGIVRKDKSKYDKIYTVGFTYFKNRFTVYWSTEHGDLIVGSFPSLFKSIEIKQYKILNKFEKNPIIIPRPGYLWEAQGTFNPGVFQDDDHTLHLFYRALGSDGISRIGYAKSLDGLHFTKRSSFPVFQPSHGFGLPDGTKNREPIHYNPGYYTSGGGWGGSEDPRLVKIGDTIYMLYVAFEGWSSVRIALSSISVSDFRAGRWNWKQPILISPPNQVNKNWVLFPEKINGKFAVLNSIVPKIMIEYVDDLENLKDFIRSPRPEGPQPGRTDSWDNLLRGAGPPPIKTDIGWLLLYHALDKREGHKYKLGAMILDLKDPSKVLYRSQHPILYPEMWYENEGKPGIVYASGAAVVGDDLFVYYGGGDRVVCVAKTHLKDFLDYLVSGKPDSYELSTIFAPVN